MSVLIQPNSVGDNAWAHILAAHKRNERIDALQGYRKLAAIEGSNQKHYQSMCDHLETVLGELPPGFDQQEYKWVKFQSKGGA